MNQCAINIFVERVEKEGEEKRGFPPFERRLTAFFFVPAYYHISSHFLPALLLHLSCWGGREFTQRIPIYRPHPYRKGNGIGIQKKSLPYRTRKQGRPDLLTSRARLYSCLHSPRYRAIQDLPDTAVGIFARPAVEREGQALLGSIVLPFTITLLSRVLLL